MNNIIDITPKATINVNNNTEARESPFKLFGTTFDNTVTSAEAIEQCGADFNVMKQPLVRVPQEVIDAIMKREPIPQFELSVNDVIQSHAATYRNDTDTTLGIVGKDFGVVDNSHAFAFIDYISEVSGRELKITSAGVLGRGERMYVQAKLGDDMYLADNDNVGNYITFTNAHDGSGAVMAFFSPLRIICKNSLIAAVKGASNKVVFKHTKNVLNRLEEIKMNRDKAEKVFGGILKFNKAFIDKMMQLRDEKVNDTYVKDFIARMYLDTDAFKKFAENNHAAEGVDEISTRAKNQMAALENAIHFGVGQKSDTCEYRGTKLWLYNGVTTLLHNATAYKSAEDEINGILEGNVSKKTQKAYDLLAA